MTIGAICGNDIEVGAFYNAIYSVVIGKDHYTFVVRI